MNQINPIIVELLAKRGIRGEAEINEFLSEKPQKTYDPFLPVSYTHLTLPTTERV